MLPKAVSTIAGGASPDSRSLLKKLEAVHARHVEVGHNDVRGKAGYLFQRFGAFRSGFRRHAPGVHHARKAGALAGFVIHNQYF